jgi:hypothetical protein
LRHHDATIGTLRSAGFSVEMTAHAYALLDSYVYGFALQEASPPFEGPETVADVAEPIMQQVPADAYPHFVEMATSTSSSPVTTSGTSSSSGSTWSWTPSAGFFATPPANSPPERPENPQIGV